MVYENWITDIFKLPLVREPGTQFEYHSAAPALFGPIIEQTSGLPVAEFAKMYLFEPLQISHYQWYIFPDGSTMTAGSLHMRPRDMAKFGYLILNKGLWLGKLHFTINVIFRIVIIANKPILIAAIPPTHYHRRLCRCA